MANLALNITAQSKPMPDEVYDEITELSFDNSGNGIEILPKDLEEFPMPWDADCYIEGGNLVLAGGVAPGGIGSAVVKVPLAKVKNMLDVYIYAGEDSEVSERLKELFTEYGWL